MNGTAGRLSISFRFASEPARKQNNPRVASPGIFWNRMTGAMSNKLNFRMKCFRLCDPIAAILLYAAGRWTVEADLTLDLAPSRVG